MEDPTEEEVTAILIEEAEANLADLAAAIAAALTRERKEPTMSAAVNRMTDNALSEEEQRQLFAALALAGRDQAWLASQLGIPLPTLRARLYRQRVTTPEVMELMWKELEAAGVRRIPARSGSGGLGVRLS